MFSNNLNNSNPTKDLNFFESQQDLVVNLKIIVTYDITFCEILDLGFAKLITSWVTLNG